MRKAAYWMLIDRQHSRHCSIDEFIRLMRACVEDGNMAIRRFIAEQLVASPPFDASTRYGTFPL